MKLPRDGCQGKDCPLYRFFESEGGYHYDPAFQRALLTRHFSETVASAYITAKATERAAWKARATAEREEAEQRLRPATTSSSIHWGEITASIIGVLLLTGLVYLLARFSRTNQPAPPPLTDTHGKVTFADPIFDVQFQHAFGFGVFLGASSAPPQNGVTPARTAPVFTVPENHTLIVARTRTGKGTRVIIPTLLRLFPLLITYSPHRPCPSRHPGSGAPRNNPRRCSRSILNTALTAAAR